MGEDTELGAAGELCYGFGPLMLEGRCWGVSAPWSFVALSCSFIWRGPRLLRCLEKHKALARAGDDGEALLWGLRVSVTSFGVL